MTIALYSRQLNVRHAVFIQKLLHQLHDNGFQTLVHSPYYQQLHEHLEVPSSFRTFNNHNDLHHHIECMFSLGGDGTLLDTLSFVRDYKIPILGINIGRLGFLANIGTDEIDNALEALKKGSYVHDRRSLIQLDSNKSLFGNVNYALNEFAIHKKDTSSMITIHAYINGEFLNSYWADGLIVSTPTGSTGYSLSCGGPILTPQAASFVVTPIAPHNLNVRPVVVPDNSVISFEIEGRGDNYLCTLDSRYETIDNSFHIAVKKCSFNIDLVRLPDHNFLNTLSKKLKWGIDSRN